MKRLAKAGAILLLAAGSAVAQEPAAQPAATVDQILERYVQAVGGRAAIERLNSRLITGRFVVGLEQGDGLEVASKAPGKWELTIRFAEEPQRMFFDGSTGWRINGSDDPEELSPSEISGFGVDYDVHHELRLREFFPTMTVQGQRTVDGKETWVIEAAGRDGSPTWLHFDAQTGLLVQRVFRRSTPEGTMTFQIRYGDYREVDGVRLPFRIERAGPSVVWTLAVDAIRHNVPLEDSRFSKPSNP